MEKDYGTVTSDFGFYQIRFFKKKEDLLIDRNYTSLVKGSERLIRLSDEYKRYIAYLKNEIDLKNCVLLSNIDDDIASIEMHHGPIFTLYDYCKIVIEYLLEKNEPVTTFRVAEIILDEHFKNNIQIVMLTTTMHQLIHSKKIYIHPSQCWGNFNNFIEKYKSGLDINLISKIQDYIELENHFGSRTNVGVFLELSRNVLHISPKDKKALDNLDH